MNNTMDFTPTGTRPKVIETKNGFLLMNQYYTKEGLQPISFNGDNLNGIQSSSDILHIASMCCLGNSVRQDFRHNQFGIIKDPYIQDTYYLRLNTQHGNVYNATNGAKSFLVSITETANDLQINWIHEYGNLILHKIIDINQNYIYVIFKHTNGTGTYCYRIAKTDGTPQDVYSLNPDARTMHTCLYKDNKYIYLCFRHNYSSWRFIRYDKDTHTNIYFDISIRTSNATQNRRYASFITDENIYSNGTKHYVYQLYNYDDPEIVGIEFDSSKPMDTSAIKDFTAYKGNELKYDETYYTIYRQWVNNEYLYLAVYSENIDDTNIISSQGIYTFKINTDGTLNYIGHNQFDNDELIISLTYSSDKSVLILGFWQQFRIAVLDKDTHQYKLSSDLTYENVSSVGFDEYNRIWVQKLNNGPVEMYSFNDPQSITINFEKNLYVYKGSNINSYISFEAINFIGKYATGYYYFELEGTAVFKDTGNQRIEIEYTGDIKKINIVVTGDDQLTCKAYYIKGGD